MRESSTEREEGRQRQRQRLRQGQRAPHAPEGSRRGARDAAPCPCLCPCLCPFFFLSNSLALFALALSGQAVAEAREMLPEMDFIQVTL